MTPGVPPHIYYENGICILTCVEVCKKATFWVARKGITFIPTTIIFLKIEMTRLLKNLKMDLKAYKSDYQAPKYDHSYDTNSYPIGIDNHASASMANT
jgi:hypothetical protein